MVLYKFVNQESGDVEYIDIGLSPTSLKGYLHGFKENHTIDHTVHGFMIGIAIVLIIIAGLGMISNYISPPDPSVAMAPVQGTEPVLTTPMV